MCTKVSPDRTKYEYTKIAVLTNKVTATFTTAVPMLESVLAANGQEKLRAQGGLHDATTGALEYAFPFAYSKGKPEVCKGRSRNGRKHADSDLVL